MTSPNANMSGSAVSGQGGIENNPSVYYNSGSEHANNINLSEHYTIRNNGDIVR